MYLSFDEYAQMGGEITDSHKFVRYALEAETTINWYTFDRLVNETEVPDKVKECMFLLINLIAEKYSVLSVNDPNNPNTPLTGIAKKRENDGVSAEFTTLSPYDMLPYNTKQIQQAIEFCLRGVVNSLGRKLLYRGLYPGE